MKPRLFLALPLVAAFVWLLFGAGPPTLPDAPAAPASARPASGGVDPAPTPVAVDAIGDEERALTGTVAPPIGLRHVFRPGERRVDHLAYRQETRVLGAALAFEEVAAPVERFGLEIEARLESVVLDANDAIARILVVIQASSLRAGWPPRELPPEFAAGVARPFLLEVRPDGSVARFVFEPEVDVDARSIVRGVLLALQVVLPADAAAGAATWQADEVDATGTSRAAYAVRRVEGGRVLLDKSAGPYASTHGEPSPGVLARRAMIDFDAHPGRVVEVRLEDRWTAGVGGVAEGEVDASLRFVSVDRDPRPLADLAAEAALRARSGRPVRPAGEGERRERAARSEAASDAALLRSVTVAGLLDLFAAIDPAVGPGVEGSRALGALTRLVAIDAAAREEVGRALRDPGVTETVALAALGALAGAGTVEAEAVLAGLAADEEVDPAMRTRAVLHLGLSTAAGEEAEAVLRDLASDPEGGGGDRRGSHVAAGAGVEGDAGEALHDRSRVALLALGGLGGRLGGRDPERAEGIARYLLERHDSARDARDRRTVLAAMGNAAHAEHVPTLVAALEEESELDRRTAAHSLRRHAGPRAEAALLARLDVEDDDSVRREIVASLDGRGSPRVLEVLRQVAGEDSSSGLEARRILAR